MAPTRRMLARIAGMGWDERKTRASQAINKRLDLARYRVGLRPRQGKPHYSAAASFLFTSAELPGRISLLKQHDKFREKIIREADEICLHRFTILGYDWLNYGPEIDWHLDPVNCKQAPLKPWFKIDFLNVNEVGDHKIIWEINRHQHLVTLAKAFCLTGDERYVRELQEQWYLWLRANPYPMGINWASGLEVAFRSLSWIWVLSLLPNEAKLRADMIPALALNGHYIEKYLSTYFSPNTHLLGEAAALFFIGTAFPGIAASSRWRERGWNILQQEAERQVRPDGLYYEQSLYYHVYALDFFLHARLMAEVSSVEISNTFDAALNRMLDVLAALSQSGPAEGFGDDDGGRLFDSRRNRTECMTDPLAVGAVLFQRENLKHAVLTEEAIWLFGERGARFLDGSPVVPPPRDQAFTSGGLYVMASGKNVHQRIVIDAGPQGTGRSGHGHADALSVTFAVDGRRCLVDSGAFCYMCADRDRFRGTAAHNTLRVDGVDQAIPDGPFAWSSIPEVRCDEWVSGETFSFFCGSHSGYMRLPEPVLHRRQVFLLKDNFSLVRDVAEGSGSHALELFWHFAPDLKVMETQNGFLGMSRESDSLLAALPVEGSGWNHLIESDFVSPAYGSREKATTMRSTSHAELPIEHATLFVSSMKARATGRLTWQSRRESSNVSAYCYEEDGKNHYLLFALTPGAWSWEDWAADASVLYFGVEGELITQFIFCGGTFAMFERKPVLSHPAGIDRFEWFKGQIISPDAAAAQSFCGEAFSLHHSSAPLSSGK